MSPCGGSVFDLLPFETGVSLVSIRSTLARGAPLLASLCLFVVTAWAVVRAIWLSRGYGGSPFDDEGYVMISLASFARGHALYDDVFTQYGPFYYALLGLPLRWSGVELTHDLVRAGTALEGIAVMLLLAWAVWRSTRSVLAACLSCVLVRPALMGLEAEPAHPHGLCLILTAAVIALLAREPARRGRATWIAVGACVAGLVLTKINVGVMAGAGVALTLLAWQAGAARRRWLWWLVAFALLALPWLWLRAALTNGVFRIYAFLVAGCVACFLAAAAATRDALAFERRHVIALLRGLLAAAFLTLLVLFLTGTSFVGTWHGVIGQHFKFVDQAMQPDLDRNAWILTSISLCLALAWSAAQRWRPALAGVAGAWLALLWGAFSVHLLLALDLRGLASWSAPFAWTALACPPNTWEDDGRARRPWALLGVATFQLLQGYPVWGTQAVWTVLWFAPLCAIALQQSVQRGCAWIARVAELPRLGTGAWYATAVIAAWQVHGSSNEQLVLASGPRPWLTMLKLHGAEHLRVTEPEAVVPRWIADMLRGGGSFYSFPALNSFYFWTQTLPPTTLNITFRLDLLDARQQRRVARDLAAQPELLVLYCDWSSAYIHQAADPERDPLVSFLRHQCHTIATWSRFTLDVRDGSTLALRSCAVIDGGALVLTVAAPTPAPAGSVAWLEVADLETNAWFGNAGATAGVAFDLQACDGGTFVLPSDALLQDGACVRLVPKDPEVLGKIAAAVAPCVRVRDAANECVRTYPIVKRVP